MSNNQPSKTSSATSRAATATRSRAAPARWAWATRAPFIRHPAGSRLYRLHRGRSSRRSSCGAG